MHWQQSGVPCFHAIALNRYYNKGGFSKKDFYYFCHRDKLIEMFEDSDSYNSVFPSDGDLLTLIHKRKPIHCVIPSIMAIDEENERSIISSKRIRSKGESKNTSTNTYRKSAKVTCGTCGREISQRTSHPPSACIKYSKKMLATEPFVTKLY